SPRSSGSSAGWCRPAWRRRRSSTASRLGSPNCAPHSWRRLDLLGDRLLDRDRPGGASRRLAGLLARAEQGDGGAEDRGGGEYPEGGVHVGDEGVELGAGEPGGKPGEDLEEDFLRHRGGDDREDE